jgi:hypothetical protein
LRHKSGTAQKTETRLHVIVCKVAITYLAVLLAEVFFRASSVGNGMEMLRAMLGLNHVPAMANWRLEWGLDKGLSPTHIVSSIYDGSYWAVLILFAIVWLMPNVLQIFADYSPTLSEPRTPWTSRFRWQPSIGWALTMGLTGGLALLAITGTTVFLYFQF